MAQLALDHIGFRYPGSSQDALSDLSLDIADGEAHALLGASGSGKTTLLNLLSGLLAPTRGQLRFNGQDVSGVAARLRNVAQVFQFPVLYEPLTVAENLAFPLKMSGLPASKITQRVDYILRELGIVELSEKKPRVLPLFEKQLVAVGKALVREDISLVLLDEPLTAVQPKVKWRLRQTLRKVQKDLQVTMIYVTHDQTEALTFADRVSLLADGRILQTGTPAELYESPEHEFVGHFVGSPGMNFVPAAALSVNAGEQIGFRPEWAVLDDDGPLQGVVTRTLTQGTRNGRPYGVVTVATNHGEISVRGVAEAPAGSKTALRVQRFIVFENKQKVDRSEHL